MRIRPFSTPGRFWRGNLHAHSNLSDGALNPGDVVEAYKRAGYDFLQVSDHFLDRFDWPIADTRKLRCNTFTTLIGAEVHAMGTSAGEYWHIVATGLPFDFPRTEPDESAPQLAKRAREAGAFVSCDHDGWAIATNAPASRARSASRGALSSGWAGGKSNGSPVATICQYSPALVPMA
jgi:predicted metal-dependent phosphoesterase TrpH